MGYSRRVHAEGRLFFRGVISARTRAGSIVTLHRLVTAIWLAGFFALCAVSRVQASDAPAAPMQLAQAQPAQAPAPAATPAPLPSPDANAPADQPAASDEPIGNVASLTGVATVIRNKDSIALKLKDDIYLNDTVQTAASSSLGITFNDATTFHLSANAKITIDTYVYADGGSNNNGAFDIAKGTVAFVAAQVAKTGNMQITTPTATLGIRGTTGLVEVPEDGGAAANANIKLYPDADGHVGRIEVNDRMGTRLGALSSGASGFSIRPGTGGARFAAVPLTISPQQQARDQGFVRQVHATQMVGRQIVTEQRAFRRANPGLNNRNAPARQPGQQPGQPGQQPGQNRPGQPGQPQPGQNRPGQPQQPGTPNNRQGDGQGQRPGQPGQPGQPARPGQTTPGQTTPPANPAAPGTPPRAGQNTPAGPAQPGTPPRPGQTAQPARPGQPGAPAQPNAVPRTGQPAGQPTPPPLPNGQPLLRQSGPPRPAPGLQRPGFQNRPAVQRPKPPPKDKKKR
jgi:FecR protein